MLKQNLFIIVMLFFFLILFFISSFLIALIAPVIFESESTFSEIIFTVFALIDILLSMLLTHWFAKKIFKIEDIYGYIFSENEKSGILKHRVLSMIADSIIILIIFFLIAKVFLIFKINTNKFDKYILIAVIFFYEPFMVSFFKGTFGHKLFKLKVTTLNNKNIFLPFAIIRFFFKMIFGIFSFATINSKRRRAIHDIITGTKVIYNT